MAASGLRKRLEQESLRIHSATLLNRGPSKAQTRLQHMSTRNEFHLSNGRVIRLTAIDQWGTYSGLLEGVPTKEMNERLILNTMDKARKRWHFEPYLIRPIERPIELGSKYPFGTPASIPDITCIGNFDCFNTARDKSMDGSTLPIVWFQSEFAFPIDEAIQEQIRSLEWEKHASDFQY
ncbi:MAG: hypothetical protein R3B84_01265 [Zavarzinella sp.]